MSEPGLLPGGSLQTPLPPVTRQLVHAAYKRALRYGTYWRLTPEQRATLHFSRYIKIIRSQTLRQILYEILQRIWPEKARYYLALQVGAQELRRRAATAARLGYTKLKKALTRIRDKAYILQLGLYVLNTHPFYRGEIQAG